MTVAFVLSGGASLGAIQVGMLRALLERDLPPEVIVGTSVGVLSGAEGLLSRGPLADAVPDARIELPPAS